MKCAHVGCTNESTCLVYLQLCAFLDQEPVTVPVMYVCDEHVGVSWCDAVAAFGWLTLRREAKRVGRALPVQSYSGVGAVSIEGAGGLIEAPLYSAGLLPAGRVIESAKPAEFGERL